MSTKDDCEALGIVPGSKWLDLNGETIVVTKIDDVDYGYPIQFMWIDGHATQGADHLIGFCDGFRPPDWRAHAEGIVRRVLEVKR